MSTPNSSLAPHTCDAQSIVSNAFHRFGVGVGMAGLILLSACNTTPKATEASTYPMPAAYKNSSGPNETAAARDVVSDAWWTQYGSEELNQLVARCLANNGDLKIATLQIAQAKTRSEVVRGGALPSVSAPIRVVSAGQGVNNDSQQNSQIGVAASLRLDVWGEQRSLAEGAEMQVMRAVHERENVQRGAIGTLVSTYIAYLSAIDSIAIARANEVIALQVRQSVELRLSLGDATQAELEQQKAIVFGLQGLIPGLENQREELRGTISRLLGTVPADVMISDKGLDELQLPAVQAGLPSDLLLGRPDIRLMEARMRAANANIAVARARLFPTFDFTAQLGYSAASLATLLQPQNLLSNVASAIAVSIFDGGQKKGEKAIAESFHEEMVETYAKTVLQAVREVESALTNLRSFKLKLEAQRGVTRAALNMFKLGAQAYEVGALDQMSYLDNRKNYQQKADEMQRAKADVLRGYATLAYALGLGSQSMDGSQGKVASTMYCNIELPLVQGCKGTLLDASRERSERIAIQ